MEDIVEAREMFVDELKNSGLKFSIVRPTGYFSDISENLKMANSGRVYLIGDGEHKINPIHGADLAKVCVDAVENQECEIPVGGPETFTHAEIAELAFSVLGKDQKITRIPTWLVNLIVKMIRPFSKRYYMLAAFFTTVMQNDFNVPKTGTHSLKKYYEEFSSQFQEIGERRKK
jgi:uncharacterized protein YbjT (DUF2867 family)